MWKSRGMAQQVFTVVSSLPMQVAFARCIDLTRVDEWDRGVTSPRRLSGVGHAVGSAYEVTVAGFDGQPTPVVYELVEVDAPRRFVMEGVTTVFRAFDILDFTPTANGCELRYDATLELLGDDPPMSGAELDKLFARVASVPAAGLRAFLNP